MEKDLDIKLYNEYLDGEKNAFELLYNKYKDKIQYFVYNIVKDYQKAEDITQDVFIYVMLLLNTIYIWWQKVEHIIK